MSLPKARVRVNTKKSFVTVTDQFCGAGGSSLGASSAGAEIRLALNHWHLAIETHNTNFPDTDHDCTDISACDPRRYPSTDILITSPECTNHSLAKGKMRRYQAQLDLFGEVKIDPSEERSRATMWDVPRFAEFHNYNFIIVENVVDARRWRLFDAWTHAMRLLGYDYEIVYLNSMFAHPTPQSRDRMYVVFWKSGNRRPDLDFRPPAHCPKCGMIESIQSWKNPDRRRWGKYGQQYVYRCPRCADEVTPFYYAAINCIDWSEPIERIGDRKRPLKEKTLARIRYGLEQYGRKPLIVTGRYTSGIECRVKDAFDNPLPTQPGDASHAILSPYIIDTSFGYSGDERATNGLEPIPTQTTRQTMALVSPAFVAEPHGKSRAKGLESPLMCVATNDHHALVTIPPAFITELHGTSKARGIDNPLMCVAAEGNHHALVNTSAFLTYYYGTMNASGLNEPVGTVTTLDRAALVEATEAVTAEDCGFRMLKPHEIGRAMAFPDTYKVLGTQRERVRQYGNAVTPPVMAMIMQRCMESLR